MNDELSLLGLFVSAFISSTLLPGGSEVVLAMLAGSEGADRWLLLAVASTGNTLGGMTSWLVGWLIARRFPGKVLEQARYAKALERTRRWGSPVLLLSWLPVIGDPLCVAAGWLRIPPLAALLFIALGKTLRYGVILFLVPT